MSSPNISVVVSVYNEELNIKPLVERISNAMEGYDYEIIYVDDGSTDNTVKELIQIQHPRLKVIEFRKNYGRYWADRLALNGLSYLDQ